MPLLCADLNIVCTRQIIKCYRKTLAIRISPILLSFSLTSRENSLKREQRSEKFAWNVATSQQLVSFNWTSICSKESGGRATSEREMKICAIPRFFMLRRFVERQRQFFPPSELLTGKQQQWAQIGAIWDGQPMWEWNLISLSSSSDWTVMWFSDFYWHTNLSHNYYPFSVVFCFTHMWASERLTEPSDWFRFLDSNFVVVAHTYNFSLSFLFRSCFKQFVNLLISCCYFNRLFSPMSTEWNSISSSSSCHVNHARREGRHRHNGRTDRWEEEMALVVVPRTQL